MMHCEEMVLFRQTLFYRIASSRSLEFLSDKFQEKDYGSINDATALGGIKDFLTIVEKP